MIRKSQVDLFGVIFLIGFSLVSGLNGVIVKEVNQGLHPIFHAGLRSLGAAFIVWAWLLFRSQKVVINKRVVRSGILLGIFFTGEFIFLFTALDLTSVIRTSVLFYTMPIWLAVAAHFLLPSERMNLLKITGFFVAFLGVVWTILDRGGEVEKISLIGDIFALLGALCWTGIVICVRSPSIVNLKAEQQLLWQLVISAPLLLLAAIFFDDSLVREFNLLHLSGLGFGIVYASAGFFFWFWLLTIYPASSVASFSFLPPIFGVFFGWILLDERLSFSLFGSALLVIIGLIMINSPQRSSTHHIADRNKQGNRSANEK